jgi:dimethylargininase
VDGFDLSVRDLRSPAMATLIALTREVSPSFARCEITHLPRQPIDVSRAQRQHLAYEQTLERLGCTVRRLAAGPDMPDCVFVEDAAVVLDEVAIITRPGAPSRRGEVAAVSAALADYRPLLHIAAPGTLDGGDVLVVGRAIYAGVSGRTNTDGVDQLRAGVRPFGYTVTEVPVRRCLHLKSAVTALDDSRVLANPAWIDLDDWKAFDVVEVDAREPMAANVVRVGPSLLCAEAFPRTRERLLRRGYEVASVDVSEIAKAEGAVTCCSLILRTSASNSADRPLTGSRT